MANILYVILSLLFYFNTSAVLAMGEMPSAPNSFNSSVTATSSAAASEQQGKLTCPAPNELLKDPKTNTWYAHGGWLSQGQGYSFVSHIDSFLQAGWVGINVGQVVCFYHGVEPGTFPIALNSNKIVYQPRGPNWKVDHNRDQPGGLICVSEDVKDCPFQVREKPKESDIYNDILQLKNKE